MVCCYTTTCVHQMAGLVVRLLAAFAAVLSAQIAPAATKADKPNIVLLFADDVSSPTRVLV